VEKSIFEKYEPEKRKLIEEILNQSGLARLATANPKTCQPHVVPLWYLWDSESVWVSGFSSTRKFRDLMANPNCAILIEPSDSKNSKLQAILFEGQVEVITQDRRKIEEISRRIYLRYLDEEGIKNPEPQSWIHDPDNMVVQLKPTKIMVW
jgi:nitroimidazol reductase NimA-like FMN-containing flavoprotein (pyridoxamine 5'-phosphate oxidase superfamily)